MFPFGRCASERANVPSWLSFKELGAGERCRLAQMLVNMSIGCNGLQNSDCTCSTFLSVGGTTDPLQRWFGAF